MREEEKNKSSQESSIKRFFKKRWVFPAIYISSAAIILTGALWYQSSSNSDSSNYDYKASDISGKKINDMPAVEVNRAMENFVMPVTNPDTAVIQKPFYEYDGKKDEQVAALVEYNNSYQPNTGIDITMKEGKTFEVVAALSGTVTDVKEDSLLGNVIEIEHDKGIVTQYQSVKDISVKVGDEVEQGQALAMAGESIYNEKAGVHVHFEIRKENVPVNPSDYFNKPLSALIDAKMTEEKPADDSKMTDDKKATDDSKTTDEKKATDDSKPADEKKSTDDSKPSDDKNTTDDKSKDNSTPKEDSTKSTDSSMNS
ncbi:M23 family metallopeptidase [Bacillus sp. 1NLA3E]|uniref:M23 family metallopeptidase n=1 Tax=Bacillus sp. 1NLA3E TaxID=666686 RepID=UPI000247E2AA|nr:M23 family metallopeptidase [Bacillus sp. 1NLA3E]AGK56000.1 peptidase M23 [Bacillus sp. 1NLA3E]